ncbi:MAG: hypothetical protein Fur0032_23590 [Terrimicrobiaceae bacterium]
MKRPNSPQAAFSLIEVSMAIGIVAFAFLGILTLLPAGLKSVRDSSVRNTVSLTERAVAESLRSATSADGTNFTFYVGTNSYTYQTGNPLSTLLPAFTSAGTPALVGDAAVAVRLDIFPPTNSLGPARAIVSTAWPASATWSGAAGWQGAEGNARRAITFLPR